MVVYALSIFIIERRYHKLLLMFILCLSSLFNSAQAASVLASLSKETIVENEPVQLTIRTDFPDTGSGPNLEGLKRDFEILGQSQNSQFRFNLGTSQSLNFWVINLMPKAVGDIKIPPIAIGDYQSNPLLLSVKNAPQLLDSNGNAPVILKMSVSEPQPYLQQEVILTMKLYTSVALQNANISNPKHPDLVIERLVDDQMHSETINGTTYQVLTRDYLAFPQVSGQLDIEPQSVAAMINTQTGKRVIKVQSLPISLQVLPVPASFTSDYWLPAQSVTIESQLQAPDNIRIGDTLNWEITISANGALPEQIAPIAFNSTADYKLYPQPTKFDTKKTRFGIEGIQTITLEIVPTSAGSITLPEIEIPYWQTEYRELRIASSDAITINVSALPNIDQNNASNNNNNRTASNAGQLLTPQKKSVAPISLAKPNTQKPPKIEEMAVNLTETDSKESFNIKPYLIFGLGILSIIGLWILWRRRNHTSNEFEDTVPTINDFAPVSEQDEKSAFNNLLEVCHSNQLSALRGHLIEWGRLRWGDDHIKGLEDIKGLCDSPELTQLIMESELIMYSDKATRHWNGQTLAEALESYVTGQPKKSQSSQLKTLYPNF